MMMSEDGGGMEMSGLAEALLRGLMESYRQSGRAEVLYDSPFEPLERRRALAEELYTGGYVEKYAFYGKSGIYCVLTPKALNAAEKLRCPG